MDDGAAAEVEEVLAGAAIAGAAPLPAADVGEGVLDGHGIARSLGRPGTCWDNAVAECFFVTLKTEFVDRYTWPTRRQARTAIFEFIEGFYNPRRRHSTLGYLSPAAFEAGYHAAASAA